MSLKFHIGQKVVCVDDRPCAGGDSSDWNLRKGAVYTVTRVIMCPDDRHGHGGLCLFLQEAVRGPCSCCGAAVPYYAGRFRPLEEKPDSIELFRAIARAVSDGKPIIEDQEFGIPKPEKVKVF
jgi:hypothetical protein